MERDELRPEGGSLDRDLEEKEGTLYGEVGDKSNQQSESSENTQFVDGMDDPNMQIARQTSELSEPDRGLAEEMAAIEHEDFHVDGQPLLVEGGADIQPLIVPDRDPNDA